MKEFIRIHKVSLGTLLAILVFASFVKIALDARVKSRERLDERYLPTPQLAEALSAGYENAMADVYWIEGINYFGEQLLNPKRDLKYLKGYTQIIFHLDPLFTVFYDWAATAFIYSGMKITRDKVIDSTVYVNEGIQRLHQHQRYDANLILKGAFNYAIETDYRLPSIPYFTLAARAFPDQREMFLVGSSYAFSSGDEEAASELKLEYLGTMAFEALTRDQLQYAFHVVSSPSMNQMAGDIIKAMRLRVEKDEDVKKVVANRLKTKSLQTSSFSRPSPLPSDPRLENIFSVDISRNWLAPDLHVLLSL